MQAVAHGGTGPSPRERFDRHLEAFDRNAALRALYADWYGRIAAALPDPVLGPQIELGSGPGLARRFVPSLILTDVAPAPWHHLALSAEALPFASERLEFRTCALPIITCPARPGSSKKRCGSYGRVGA